MDARSLPAAVLAAAGDRRGGAMEVAATAVDGLLEVAGDPPRLEAAVAALEAGQPAMAPIWHLAAAARAPDPAAALTALRERLTADADAAVAAATAWLRRHLAAHPGQVATVSHSSLVARVLARAKAPSLPDPRGTDPDPREYHPDPRGTHPVRRRVPRWGSVADRRRRGAGLSTAPEAGGSSASTDPAGVVVGVVGADAIGPRSFLNAAGTRELAARVPTLVVATEVKLVPGEVFGRMGGRGFEVVELAAVRAVVVGAEVLSPAEAGRRAGAVSPGRP
jgi:hypothetical protein